MRSKKKNTETPSTKEAILRLLRSAQGGYTSGEEIAAALGISRTAIWKHIRALEEQGYEVEAVPSKGYRLMGVPDLLNTGVIEQALETRIIGKTIRYLTETLSTNSLAMELAAQGAADGTVVVAETQTGGKGRLGRAWISPAGNLYLSVIVRPQLPPHKAPLLTLTAAVAVASAIRKHLNVHAEIKWPNDIFVAEKKVGGLLTEMSAEPDRVRHVALGLGVNVNMDPAGLPPEVRTLATTLAAEYGEQINRTELLIQLLTELDRWYQVFLKNEAAVLSEWESLNMTVDRRVTVSGFGETFAGTAQGIDSEGRLILRLDDGSLRLVAAGDVTIVKK